MLILQQWLAEALLPSMVAFYFIWDSFGQRDGKAVRLRWWGYAIGTLTALLIAVALRFGFLLLLGGKAIVNPTNEWALLVYGLLPAVGALIASLALLGVSVGVLTREDPESSPPPPSHAPMKAPSRPDLHWRSWSTWLLLLYLVATFYVNVRPTQQAELVALVMVLVLIGVPLLVLYVWKGIRPASRVRPLFGAFTTGSALLGLAVLGELPHYRSPIWLAQPAPTSASSAKETVSPVHLPYPAVPAQETSEEYLDRMFAAAVERFFADEQNNWILREEIMVRFERHIAAVSTAEPTLSYDSLLIRARTALENELGDLNPAPQTYSAASAQETSEEYMRRMFAEAESRFFADEQNSWILHDEVLLRFDEHISAVFAMEPTLNYDDLLVRARTALTIELGQVSPAAPVARSGTPPTLIDPFPKRGCSYRGVMTDAEIAECRRQGPR